MPSFYEIQPKDLTIIRNKRELYFHVHLHKYVEILYVYKGSQLIDIDGISYKVEEGDIAIIFPNIIHNYYKEGGTETDELIIVFDFNILNGNFINIDNYSTDNPIIKKEKVHEDAEYALKHIAFNNSITLKLGWLYIIMSYIIDAINLNLNNRSEIENLTGKIIKYIEENYKKDISISTIAYEFGLSKYYVSRIFSEKIKMNFRSYLGLIRARYASKLIRSTNKSLTDISIESGFECQRTFNRMFKSVYGMTPREFRQKNK